MGEEDDLHIREQYAPVRIVSSSVGDGVITAIKAVHQLSDMGLLALLNVGFG